MQRAVLAVAALILVGAHLTGNMKTLTEFFDLGLEPHQFLYIAVLPFTCVFTYYLLARD